MRRIRPTAPTAPITWHAFSPDFLARAGTQAHDQLMALLPFRSLAITGLVDRPGTYVTILDSEDRSKELRRAPPFGPPPAETGSRVLLKSPGKKSPPTKRRSRSGERPQAQTGRCS